MYIRKQNNLWAEGDVFREKMLNERENGKMAVTRILSGVDDITINGSNKNRAAKKEEMELVSFEMVLSDTEFESCTHKQKKTYTHHFVSTVLQYNDEEERNGLTQGDKLRALKSKRQARSSSGSLS